MVGVEYLLVVFPEKRAVLADDNEVGFTNHTLILPANEYSIALAGGGYTPDSIDVVLNGTSVVKPKVVVFELAAAAVATRGVRAPRTAPAPRRKRAPASRPKPTRRSTAGGKPKARRGTASTGTGGKRRGG